VHLGYTVWLKTVHFITPIFLSDGLVVSFHARFTIITAVILIG